MPKNTIYNCYIYLLIIIILKTEKIWDITPQYKNKKQEEKM